MRTTRVHSKILVSLAAAAGAFGAAAMMSTAAAPTARADDFTDLINAVEADYAAGQNAFTDAVSDFGSNQFPAGLSELFDGLDDDSVAAPNNIAIGTVELLTNESITSSIPVTFDVPTSYAEGLSEAQNIFTYSETLFTDASSSFALGAYGVGTEYDLLGLEYLTIFPLQELLLGAASSL